jgi:hypothetical protein
MRFSPRSLLAWFHVAIAGGDPLGRGAAMRMPGWERDEAGLDDRPAEQHTPRSC